MNCLNCDKEFTPIRASAKFCSSKCRVSHARGGSVTKEVSVHPSVTPDFIPNWERKGLKSIDEAIYCMLAWLSKNSSLEGAVFHVKNKTWVVDKGKIKTFQAS